MLFEMYAMYKLCQIGNAVNNAPARLQEAEWDRREAELKRHKSRISDCRNAEELIGRTVVHNDHDWAVGTIKMVHFTDDGIYLSFEDGDSLTWEPADGNVLRFAD